MKFIYVFDASVKEQLLALGYVLLKEDAAQSIYVFEANSSMQFSLPEADLVYSDTLTF